MKFLNIFRVFFYDFGEPHTWLTIRAPIVTSSLNVSLHVKAWCGFRYHYDVIKWCILAEEIGSFIETEAFGCKMLEILQFFVLIVEKRTRWLYDVIIAVRLPFIKRFLLVSMNRVFSLAKREYHAWSTFTEGVKFINNIYLLLTTNS